MKHVLLVLVRVYQAVAHPLKVMLTGSPEVCRFHPTCSEYARQAIDTHGALRGSWLAMRRLLRCHPWGGRGHDPVP